MGTEATTKARQKRKADLVYIHGEKCALCGYDKCLGALQFHHIDPTQKKYGLSSGNCHSWELDVEESKKCILVCANCHAEIHQGLISTPLKSSFIQNRSEKKTIEIVVQEYRCKSCGTTISKGARYCSKCWSLLNRKVERPSREELKDLIRNKTFLEIGRLYGVSDNAIRKWCDDYLLPRKKVDIKKYSNEDWVNL